MNRSIRSLLCFLSLILLCAGCRKKEWDEYYGRPDDLAPPIYQQLQEKQKFNLFLKVIDKAGYTETLNSAGLWTLFAPNDEAFQKFLQAEGYNDVSQIDDSLARKIVRYNLLYDAYRTNRISDYFSSKGWLKNFGFRRRTTYYDFVYDAVVNNKVKKVINANGNGFFNPSDFNNKYITYLTTGFTGNVGLSESDFKYFYPNAAYSSLNVLDAKVLETDIPAENGVIHEVDKVLLPLKSIDQYISSKKNAQGELEYSKFKELLDLFVTYPYDGDITHKYSVLTGRTDSVFIKLYNGGLAFSPNNENYLKEDPNDAQSGNYSILVPSNVALNSYIKEVLLRYYPAGTTINQLFKLNSNILQDFINAHMWRGALWPSKFGSSVNALGEEARISADANVTDRQILSNGFLYGTNAVQRADVFSSVYGKAYLDPKFSIMTRSMDYYGYTLTLRNAKIKNSLILIPDSVLKKMGFTFDSFFPNNPVRLNGQADNQVLKRLIETHIIPTVTKDEVKDIQSAGIVETRNGDYVKFSGGRFSSAGTMDSIDVAKRSIRIDSSAESTNGWVHYASGVLSYTEKTVGQHIANYAKVATDPFYKFYQYLSNNKVEAGGIFNSTTGDIQGVSIGVNYTVFVPTNAAIDKAVAEGMLPASVAPTNPDDIVKVTRFIQHHILNKNTVVPDGKKSGLYETLLKNSNLDIIKINIQNSLNDMTVVDMNGRPSKVVVANSNVLSNRTVIHSIDNYLKYTY